MLLAYLFSALLLNAPGSNRTIEIKSLSRGLELLKIMDITSSPKFDITILRIDPKHYDLVCSGVNLNPQDTIKSAKEWCRSKKLVAAINAGMFATDYKTHTGFLKYDGKVFSNHETRYQSVIAFKPVKQSNLPQFHIYDLDAPGVTIKYLSTEYSSLIQNLRLIKKPAINVWGQSDKVWSEAALGEDSQGRILFIYSKQPVSMHDLNEELLQSNIGIVAAQHLEGGPLAQLYIHVGTFELNMSGGTSETSNKNLPIPNVMGIRAK